MLFQRIQKTNGFTLLEIISVLALISIFSVLAIIQHSASDATLVAQAQVLASHIRYAQMRAMNTDANWGIYYNFSGADPADCYYLLYRGTNPADIAQLPGESRDRVYIGSMKIRIASAIGAWSPVERSFELRFDSWGRPRSFVANSWHTDTLTLRLTKSGQTPINLVITKNTGFIQ